MSPNVIWLSHPLSPSTPSYGGGEGMQIEIVSKISSGDTANSSRYILPNHIGTHIDVPRHFFDSGKTLTDYPADYWIFNNPLLIDIPCKDGYLISVQDVEAKLTSGVDLLLLRTGFETFRGTSHYWEHNPGLSPKFGTWIRKNFPNIRAVGMDFISVTSPHHRAKGRESHRNLLNPDGISKPVLPVEDMSLKYVSNQLSQVIISPLIVNNTDGGVCTIFGLFSNLNSEKKKF